MWKLLLAVWTVSLIGCSDYNLEKIVKYAPEIEVTPLEHDFGPLNADGETGELIVTILNVWKR